jgi:hypothetical protein
VARIKKPFRLKKRGKYYHYKLKDESTFHSTGQTSITKAETFVIALIEQGKKRPILDMTLKEYADLFYVWETCPHVRRLLDEKKSIGKR